MHRRGVRFSRVVFERTRQSAAFWGIVAHVGDRGVTKFAPRASPDKDFAAVLGRRVSADNRHVLQVPGTAPGRSLVGLRLRGAVYHTGPVLRKVPERGQA